MVWVTSMHAMVAETANHCKHLSSSLAGLLSTRCPRCGGWPGLASPTRMDDLAAGQPALEEAPPVVAVMVVRDPGPSFEEALSALAQQDYPALSILVVDANSAEDPTDRVAAAVPSAFVRRLHSDPGYAAAANEVLKVVKGASHLLFVHDDVAPAPDAVRLMLEAAYRGNAGIATPKLVD